MVAGMNYQMVSRLLQTNLLNRCLPVQKILILQGLLFLHQMLAILGSTMFKSDLIIPGELSLSPKRGNKESVYTSGYAELLAMELHCPPCARLHCVPHRHQMLKCKGGWTRGICNCCPVCAKV